MRYVKILGAAAIASAALVASMGGSSASATVLCKTQPTEGSPATKGTVCPANWTYLAGTEIHAVLDPGTGPAKLTNENGETQIVCEETTVKGTTENEGGATETVGGKAQTVTVGKCTTPAFFNAPCKVTTIKGGTLEVHWIADTWNGTITSNEAVFTSLCETGIFGNIHCIFKTENDDLGTLTGGNPATMDIENTFLRQEPTSELCPKEARWDAKYEVTAPKPLYVAGHT